MFKVLIFTAALFLVSCNRSTESSVNPDPSDNTKEGAAVVAAPGIAVSDAETAECSAGGKVYNVYLDRNNNGSFDDGEESVSRQVVCNGVAGNDGANGADGSSGISLVFQTVPTTTQQCVAGGVTLLMALDSDRSGAVSVADENLQAVTICNGSNGTNGVDGVNGTDGQNGAPAPVSGFTPVDYIAACGNTVSFKEILLRLQNGQVLGSFSNSTSGDMTRLAFLPDGVFMNTDNSGCVFSLSTSSDGTSRSISWSGQVQQTWSMSPAF